MRLTDFIQDIGVLQSDSNALINAYTVGVSI